MKRSFSTILLAVCFVACNNKKENALVVTETIPFSKVVHYYAH